MNDPQNVIRPESLPVFYCSMLLGALSVPFLLWLQTDRFRKADYEVACQMATLTGDPRVQVFVDHHFGRLSDQEADERIERLEQEPSDPEEYRMPLDQEIPTYDPYAASTGF